MPLVADVLGLGEDLERQIAELQALTPRFREPATETSRPPEPLRLLAAEEMPAYHQCSPYRG